MNTKKALFVADPVEVLKPETDTSLYLMREAIRRQISVSFGDAHSISWVSDRVVVRARAILDLGSRSQHPRLGPESESSLQDFDFVFIRKEPPFNEDYQKLCWLLRPYEKKIRFFNPPSSLLLEHEKMIPLSAVAEGVLKKNEIIESCVTDDLRVALDFAKRMKTEHLICKPWLGHGGRDIQLFDRESFIKDPHEFWKDDEEFMLQPFHEAIFERGDRRVLTMNGKVLGNFVRLPKKGHFVSNLVRGGQAFLRDLEAEEISILDRFCSWLNSKGILFAGLDFIDAKLSEVNVTSPTGLGAFEDLTGRDLSREIWDAFEAGPQGGSWIENSSNFFES